MSRLSTIHSIRPARVAGSLAPVQPAELPVIQVTPYGATGVTVEIHSTHYNTAGYREREHATAQLAYAEAVILVETLEEIIGAADGYVAHARNAAQAAARLRQKALEERQLDLLREALMSRLIADRRYLTEKNQIALTRDTERIGRAREPFE